MAEEDRLQLVIGTLVALSALVFLIIVGTNAGTFLVGWVLLVFQIAIAAVAVGVALTALMLMGMLVLRAIGNMGNEILARIGLLERTIRETTRKLGPDILALTTAFLTFPIQESVAPYPLLYRLSVSVFLGINFFLASRLISNGGAQRFVGIFFYLAAPGAFLAAVALTTPYEAVVTWVHARSVLDLALLFFILLAIALTFTFALLRNTASSVSA